jgi:hypothetical protein
MQEVNQLWFSFNSSTTPINTLATVATSSKSSVIKQTQKERDQEANANSGSCQNRTTGKDQFFRKSSIAQIEKCKTNEI